MTRRFFFDVPVYRIAEKAYSSESNAFVENKFLYLTGDLDADQRRKFFESNPDLETRWREHARKDFGGPWQFNEIVGYIRLYFFGRQVRGELWWVDAKRIIRTRKKILWLKSVNIAGEVRIPSGSTNRQVYDLILQYVDHARQRKILRQRHLDTTIFETIGRHVDWRALMKSGPGK